MIPKTWRIPKKEFPQILSNGKRYNSNLFTLYTLKGSGDTIKNSRFAFSVSKKVSKTAVSRNKLRRQGYSVIQNNKKRIIPGFFIFFSFKKTKDALRHENIEQDVLELLSVSGVLL